MGLQKRDKRDKRCERGKLAVLMVLRQTEQGYKVSTTTIESHAASLSPSSLQPRLRRARSGAKVIGIGVSDRSLASLRLKHHNHTV